MSEKPVSEELWDMAGEKLEDVSAKYVRPLLDASAKVARYEKALRQIRSGLTRRGKNVSYGGGRVGTLRRAEMIEIAKHALLTAEESEDE